MRPNFAGYGSDENGAQNPSAKAGEVLSVNFAEGDRVDMGATLVELGD